MASPTLKTHPASRSERSEDTTKLNFFEIESNAALRLNTGSLQSSPSRRIYHCRFVKAGRVRTNSNTPSDIEITPQALQTAWSAGLFNRKAVYIEHAALRLANFSVNYPWK